MNTTAKSVTLLDGGMGQELLRRSGAEPTPMWSAQVMKDNPEIVRDLHVDFIKAGAQVITINAYSATPERLARDSIVDLFEDLQLSAINAAIDARETTGVAAVKVAGCLPPLVGSYRPDLAPEYDTMLATYKQVVAVQAPHVDVFQCETMSSINEARASSVAALETGLPVWVGLSVEDNDKGLLRSGEPLEEAVAMLDELGVHAKLINCSQPEAINAAWTKLASGQGPIGAYANGFTSISALDAGGTVDVLSARQDLGPENYAAIAMGWVEQGATLVGGCCEVGPEHIALIAQRLKESGLYKA